MDSMPSRASLFFFGSGLSTALYIFSPLKKIRHNRVCQHFFFLFPTQREAHAHGQDKSSKQCNGKSHKIHIFWLYFSLGKTAANNFTRKLHNQKIPRMFAVRLLLVAAILLCHCANCVIDPPPPSPSLSQDVAQSRKRPLPQDANIHSLPTKKQWAPHNRVTGKKP
jgi:hypothetical protein